MIQVDPPPSFQVSPFQLSPPGSSGLGMVWVRHKCLPVAGSHPSMKPRVPNSAPEMPVNTTPSFKSYAEGFFRMIDVVGVDHVGLGTDQMGLLGPSSLPSYADLPQLAAALRAKFNDAEVAKLLGGNYRRVFEASLA